MSCRSVLCIFEMNLNKIVCVLKTFESECVCLCACVCLCCSSQGPERGVQSEATRLPEQRHHGRHLCHHSDQLLCQLLRIQEDRLLPMAAGTTPLLTPSRPKLHSCTLPARVQLGRYNTYNSYLYIILVFMLKKIANCETIILLKNKFNPLLLKNTVFSLWYVLLQMFHEFMGFRNFIHFIFEHILVCLQI